ncbi:MAG: porin, partial [Candidatus Limnocylindrus sp.]
DHGFMVHGTLGCNSEWSYMVAVTNGDGGDSIRNVWDVRTDDNLAYSARLNWAFLKPTFYEESALRQSTCEWYGEAGAWAHAYDNRLDGPHRTLYDGLVWGVDLALGYGGLSVTAAYTSARFEDVSTTGGLDVDSKTLLLQAGYLFPGTAWELAARYSSVSYEPELGSEGSLVETAAVVNYYLNGHANKISLDVTLLSQEDAGVTLYYLYADAYSGLRAPVDVEAEDMLVRFQWQLAL